MPTIEGRQSMIVLLITALAALAFVCCLLQLAGRRRQHAESAYAGSHGRARHQPPGRILWHAIATAGTRGLGVIRKSDGSETICTLTAIRLASGLFDTVVVRVG